MDDRIIWVGNRESEILYSGLFYKSITRYGSNINNNVSYNNSSGKTILDFFIESINKEIEKSSVKLFFYSNKIAERVIAKAPYLKEYVINKYNPDFLDLLENKTYSHLWASNIMPVINFTEMFGKECNYENISSKFKNKGKYIIQENYSSGGTGTFVLTKENETDIIKKLDDYSCYMISPYLENSYSINVHIIITDNYVSVLPASIQIIENVDNRLLYKGADFIAYRKISASVQQKVSQYAKNIGMSLSNMGYVGICGLDLLIQNEDIYFMEINPRFQASSILINCALKDLCLPDLQTIVYNVFNNKCEKELLKQLEKVKINYSTLSFYQNTVPSFNAYLLGKLKQATKHVDKVIVENPHTNNVDDYMFRVIFTTNISSVNFDGSIFVYQNLLNYSRYTKEFYKSDINMLKCALLTQGVIITDDVKDLYNDTQEIKKATFDAVDITIYDKYVINCPVNVKFLELTPFSIQKNDNGLGLYYFDDFIYEIKISLQEKLPVKYTKNNIGIHRIGFLTTDRLRIKHTSICNFKKNHSGCKFCHITSKYCDVIPIDDIYETIDYYESFVDFNHFLIGGPSNTYDNEQYYINNIVKYIRSKSNKPIYVMSIPPDDCNILHTYYDIGVTEVAFNLEIFNRRLAESIMPGKGKIPIKQYEDALKLSSQLFGIENTRSMLIIGLDSKKSFLKGIEFLCKLGVTPMISPFRPMEGTELSDFVPPPIDYIVDVYLKSKKICRKYNIRLGPKCDFCKNNTLT